MGDLIALMNADRDDLRAEVDSQLDDMIARHKPLAAQELADLGIGWLTLHVDKSPPQLIRFVEEALPVNLIDEWAASDSATSDERIRLYQVRPAPPAGDRSIELASADATAFLAGGWSSQSTQPFRYANRASADLVLAIPSADGNIMLTHPADMGPISVKLNGQPIATAELNSTTSRLSFSSEQANSVVDRLTLSFAPHGLPVTALSTASSPIGTTGLSLDAGHSVVVHSAGEDVGGNAEIWIDGVNVASGARGYNLAHLDARGDLLGSATFDTHASAAESARLAAWIEVLPANAIVAGAVADDASHALTSQARSALASLGLAPDFALPFRGSHAFIGARGAQPSTAVEDASQLHPARVWIGSPVDGERVYGALETVTVQSTTP
jgi:hypothetical protein